MSEPNSHSDDEVFRQASDNQIFAIFDEVSDLPLEQRPRFLDLRCGAESPIRVEIERLLAHQERVGILDESMPHRLEPQELQPQLPLFAKGYTIAHRFRIIRTIGSGGMGTVYEAEDLSDGDHVALKTIRAGETSGGELSMRLRRELRLARDIDHPNVCRVFTDWDVEDPDGGSGRITFFTMELLEGETLAQRLTAKNKIKPGEAISILRQIAAGIDEVHRANIVHRDLKPSNIFLVRDPGLAERAVVMDFGVARNSAAATVESNATVTGARIGTPRYMSPEQANGERVDRSSDIYSFGVLAFEIVTGVNHPLVSPSSLVPGLSPSWNKGVLSCFLSPAQRPKTAAEVVATIGRRVVPWKPAMLALATALVLAIVFWQASRSEAAARYGAEGATQITFDEGFTGDPASTADGNMLVYATDRDSAAGDLNIWSHRLDTNETRRLTADHGDEDEPAISPNGQLLAYRRGSNNTLYVKQLPGGEPRAIGPWTAAPRFSPDGKTLAYWSGHTSTPGQIWLLPLAPGSRPRRIAGDFADARFPLWSPNGKTILFRGTKFTLPSIEANQEWWITDPEGKSYKATGAAASLAKSNVIPHNTPAAWDGNHVIFCAANGDSRNLWRLNLFSILGHVFAEPQVITTGSGFQTIPALISHGRVAYADWRRETHIWRIDPPNGKLTQVTTRSSLDAGVTSSTDGSRIAFVRIRSKARDVWIRDVGTGSEREMLHGENVIPLLSPAGDKIAISAGPRIWLLDIASGQRTVVAENGGEILTWTPDGLELVFVENRTESRQSLVSLRLNDKSRRVLLEDRGLHDAGYSPDGRRLAVSVRRDSTHSQIKIATVRPDSSVGEWKMVTGDGYWSERPVWSADGLSINFVTDQDGFWCIFNQLIDSRALKSARRLKAVAHLHSATTTLSHLVDSTSGMARASAGGIFLCIGHERSNIWAMRP